MRIYLTISKKLGQFLECIQTLHGHQIRNALYFMLKEKYRYISKDQTGNAKVSTLEFYNRNQHILGVANFSLNFEQKVSRNLSIGVQPFYKTPLTGIGYHDTNLKSKGVAFSLNIGLPGGKK